MQITKVKDEKFLRFENVEMKECGVEDEEKAFKIAGVAEGYDFQLALLAQLCTFDGKKYVMEDLRKMSRADFLDLVRALTGLTTEDLQKISSSSQDTEDFHTKKSEKCKSKNSTGG